MEKLLFDFTATEQFAASTKSVLCGVVSSGNLEVMVEAADLGGVCRVEIETSASGFADIWQAVLTDVFDRWKIGDVVVSINDAGATPAVVALRLDQALTAYSRDRVGARR
ncbi:malonate decarboxylase acyl carrier protein [Rhizobium sp. SG741]|uniref:malonate decarboxylase acyl carrier protein n=1 Tax=Rhizobium sp. SG741 TaxID=2587114 RepID=UPI001446B2D2|nr:malonate decarboxylase acyl carrier protein [Rhizobium sp. SG741]NKJ08429.1 malonate decarboxylase delta subunit [Rhizobium sp. SG741]